MMNSTLKYTRLPSELYSFCVPETLGSHQIVSLNKKLMAELSLDELQISELLLNSNNASNALAMAYAGHQFGHFNILGDGRAHLLAEFIVDENKIIELHSKGSGRTPYSRSGDGRATLGPMLREFLISEYMYALGIPTTRSLAVMLTGERVYREKILPGAVLLRTAKSYIRVGTFEYASRVLGKHALSSLVAFAIERFCPEALNTEDQALRLLRFVIQSQAKLVAQWMSIGFIHGVMNTDNVMISGETIDYGPCAFMDQYSLTTVFSSIDRNGRYAYGQQPEIMQWNLTRFAESLLPLISERQDEAVKLASEEIKKFNMIFSREWLKLMNQKIGLLQTKDQDFELQNELLNMMEEAKSDFTNSYRFLSGDKDISSALSLHSDFHSWQEKLKLRMAEEGVDQEIVQKKKNLVNPVLIPRNHLVESALELAIQDGNFDKFNQLLEVVQKPFSPDHSLYFRTPGENQGAAYRTYCGT